MCADPAVDSITVIDDRRRHIVHIPGAGASRAVLAAMEAVERSKACIAASLGVLGDQTVKVGHGPEAAGTNFSAASSGEGRP